MNKFIKVFICLCILTFTSVLLWWHHFRSPEQLEVWVDPLFSTEDALRQKSKSENFDSNRSYKTVFFRPVYFSRNFYLIEPNNNETSFTWSDFQVSRSYPRYNFPAPSGGEDFPEWWLMQELDASPEEGVRFSVRPSEELLQQVWDSDFDLNDSFRGIDIRRPPVRAEFIFHY